MNLIILIFIIVLNLIFYSLSFVILLIFFILLQSIFYVEILQITAIISLDNNLSFIKEIIKLR